MEERNELMDAYNDGYEVGFKDGKNKVEQVFQHRDTYESDKEKHYIQGYRAGYTDGENEVKAKRSVAHGNSETA